jgi:hypothetical protein
LTPSLIPYFEEALAQENKDRESNSPHTDTPHRIGGRGPTLPSNPKSGFSALRKPPSLSTLAMPNFSGMKPPSQSLINVLRALVAQLPEENRDLLKTITELIKATAKDQKITKMPLSNLLLVLCPSLNMNPPTLRAFCEADGIWNAAPPAEQIIDIRRDEPAQDAESKPTATGGIRLVDDNSDSESEDEKTPATALPQERDREVAHRSPVSASPISPSSARGSTDSHRAAIPRARPMGPRRAMSPTSVRDMHSELASALIDSSLPLTAANVPIPDDDSASSLSVSEGTSDNSRLGASSPLAMSSSAESLRTPSSMSESASFASLPPAESLYAKPEEVAPGPPAIADPAEWKQHLQHIVTATPGSIQFPSTGSLPSTPLSVRRASKLLSSPSMLGLGGGNDEGSNSVPSSPRKRMKRPSLQLLLSKRSASSLSSGGGKRPQISGPYLQTAENPTGLPLSAYSSNSSVGDARTQSTYILDTQIDSSTFDLNFGYASPRRPQSEAVTSPVISEPERTAVPPMRSETPIADLFLRSSGSNDSDDEDYRGQLRPQLISRNRSSSGASFVSALSVSSTHLDSLDDQNVNETTDAWTKSVLMDFGNISRP